MPTMFVRIARQLFIVAYLFLTFCALLYTLARKQISWVQWPYVTHFYAMMAPFQNYTVDNVELMVYGKFANGQWEKIDITEYIPAGRGERAIRLRMSSFHDKRAKFKEMATHILRDKKKQGTNYTTVRIQWEKWPKSQYGFYGNYTAEKVTKTVMAEAS